MNRRDFIAFQLKLAAVLPLAISLGPACNLASQRSKIKGAILGANAKAGHILRDSKPGTPAHTENISCLVVGGGVAGLSASRRLKQIGLSDFRLLELDSQTGGNSVSSSNEVSAYPWGAHYIPLPDHRDSQLLQLLEECGSITGYDDAGLPVYNEYHLCFDPEERLFMRGQWHEGIVPSAGLIPEDKQEIQHFFKRMEFFRNAKGTDGLDAFAIPLKLSSTDEEFRQFDRVSFKQFLLTEGFHGEALHWYVNYCCRDDFGTTSDQTSAWAGIHYFAGRKGKSANAKSADVLTWPEGNGFLAQHLMDQVKDHVLTNQLVYKISIQENDSLFVDCINVDTKVTIRYNCKKLLLCTPQFINNRLLDASLRKVDQQWFTYAPWMVANLTVKNIPDENGFPISWDNVIYKSPSLGYVDATHQHLNSIKQKRVLTYYLPLSDKNPEEARRTAQQLSHSDWVNRIFDDLKAAHPMLEQVTEQVDVWLWGHGMIRPQPGFLWGNERMLAAKPIENKIFFAHSDLSGISIFEEAFHQGINGANELMASL